MLIKTDVRVKPSRAYRLIDGDLWSAATNKPIEEQEYEREKAGVLDPGLRGRPVRVVIRGGYVWLEG